MRFSLIAVISMLASLAAGTMRLPPPFLIASQPQRIEANWPRDNNVTANGVRWTRTRYGWLNSNHADHRWERSGSRWIEIIDGRNVSEIRISSDGRSVTYRRGTQRVDYHRANDGSLSRPMEFPVRARERQPSRFERNLTRGLLHNP